MFPQVPGAFPHLCAYLVRLFFPHLTSALTDMYFRIQGPVPLTAQDTIKEVGVLLSSDNGEN